MNLLSFTKAGERNKRASQRGSVLLVVIILSTIVLAVMTTVLYMIMMGSQITGMEKRYRTAHDAALGGTEILKQLIGLRADPTNTNAFIASLAANNVAVTMSSSLSACQGSVSGTPQTIWAAKVLTPSSSWNSSCKTSTTIDPSDSGTYDMSIQLGATGNRYMVYAKVIRVTPGNSSGDLGGLWLGGVTNTSGDVQIAPLPFQYTIEVDAESAVNRIERAKFSLVYQY